MEMTLFVSEAVSSMGLGSMPQSGLLTAYAILLGTNNLQIGMLASHPFVMQLSNSLRLRLWSA